MLPVRIGGPLLFTASPGDTEVLRGETTLVVFAYRSDKHAAVLRLQRTQPKDRRVYDAPYRILCITGAGREEKRSPIRTGSTKSPRKERGTECCAGIGKGVFEDELWGFGDSNALFI